MSSKCLKLLAMHPSKKEQDFMLAQCFKDRVEMYSKNVLFTPHTHILLMGQMLVAVGSLQPPSHDCCMGIPAQGKRRSSGDGSGGRGPRRSSNRGRTFGAARKGSAGTSFHQLLASDGRCRERKETPLSFRRRRQRLVARVSQPRRFFSSVKLRLISSAEARGRDPPPCRCPEGDPGGSRAGHLLDAEASRNHGSKKQQANGSNIFTLHNGNQLDAPDQTFQLK